MKRLDAEELRRAVEAARASGLDRQPRELLRWAWDLLGESVMMTTALQKGGLVLLHMVKDIAPELPVYFLDTGFHFHETLRFFEEVRNRWKVRLILKRPKVTGADFVARYGERLYQRDPDLCCHLNKTESLAELFGPHGTYQGWITSIRRDQGVTRADATTLELLEGGLVKVQPLAYWTRAQVEGYVAEHGLPRHPLYSRGYTSIGCEPCTSCPAAAAGSGERDNRWVNLAKKECGLHTFWQKAGKAPPEPPPAAGETQAVESDGGVRGAAPPGGGHPGVREAARVQPPPASSRRASGC